jgi:hypothetical protein
VIIVTQRRVATNWFTPLTENGFHNDLSGALATKTPDSARN